MPTALEPIDGLDLTRSGTPETAWREALDALASADLPGGDRVVVIAPHPDDETLGVGGIVAMLCERGTPVVVISLTDGEAASDEPGLADRRHAELLASLAVLGGGADIFVQRLRLPDGDLDAHAAEAEGTLTDIVGVGDIVLAPFDDDGHCDHDSAGRIARSVCGITGATLRLYPVWAWHWHEPARSVICERGERVLLSASAVDAKQRAMACFVSQFTGDQPVVPADMLARSGRPYEVLVRP